MDIVEFLADIFSFYANKNLEDFYTDYEQYAEKYSVGACHHILGDIEGDFLVVEIDRKKREFQNISQKNIIWFTEDLMNRNLIFKDIKPKIDMKSFAKYASNDMKKYNNANISNNFEQNLLNVLRGIHLALSYLVTNNKKGGN